MELVNGRPMDTTGRLEKEIRVYDLLDSLGISYQRIDHEAAMTMEACREIDEVLDATICKNLFLCNRQKTQYYLLMMPGEKKFLTRVLSKELGVARLSFAPEEDMEALLDLTPGSVTVLGLMNDTENRVQLVMDQELLEGTYIGCHPCINTSSLRLPTQDLMEKLLPAMKHTAIMVRLEET